MNLINIILVSLLAIFITASIVYYSQNMPPNEGKTKDIEDEISSIVIGNDDRRAIPMWSSYSKLNALVLIRSDKLACSGALISEIHVLTACHCLFQEPHISPMIRDPTKLKIYPSYDERSTKFGNTDEYWIAQEIDCFPARNPNSLQINMQDDMALIKFQIRSNKGQDITQFYQAKAGSDTTWTKEQLWNFGFENGMDENWYFDTAGYPGGLSPPKVHRNVQFSDVGAKLLQADNSGNFDVEGGQSGGPVIEDYSNMIVGVVSGEYNQVNKAARIDQPRFWNICAKMGETYCKYYCKRPTHCYNGLLR